MDGFSDIWELSPNKPIWCWIPRWNVQYMLYITPKKNNIEPKDHLKSKIIFQTSVLGFHGGFPGVYLEASSVVILGLVDPI